jgi:hypothetical protein
MNGVTVLNFDQTYLLQTNLEKPSYEWIHFLASVGFMVFYACSWGE